jgi:hypothetical protein
MIGADIDLSRKYCGNAYNPLLPYGQKEAAMREQLNYETFLKVANTISHSKNPKKLH